jgi:hypothetical protein
MTSRKKRSSRPSRRSRRTHGRSHGNAKRASRRSGFSRREGLDAFFKKLGYTVEHEGRLGTGERWVDVYDDGNQVFQIDDGVSLQTFLYDLPSFARGKEGPSNADYSWVAEDDADTREMVRRAKARGYVLGHKPR